MRKILLIIGILCFSFSNLQANDDKQLLIEANNHYKSSEYSEAIAIYHEIIDLGYESSDIYYNLANAYFKTDRMADAILFYERAKKLNPDDEDIDFNLKIANLKIVDKINEVPKIFFIEWYEDLYKSLSSDTWSMMIIVFAWLTVFALLGYLLFYSIGLKKLSFFTAIISFTLIILVTLFAFEQYTEESRTDEAIIFNPSVYVKSSPDKSSTDLFILHEGTKVQILDKVGNWNKIKIADGNIGWIDVSTIEVI